MAPPKGPLANTPRDLRDDFVGVPPEELPDGPPMRWPPKPKKITKDTFHAKVQGRTSEHRADRAPHYRKGGWVKAAKGGKIGSLPYGEGVSKGYVKSISEKSGVKGKESKTDGVFSGENKRGGHVKKRARGGEAFHGEVDEPKGTLGFGHTSTALAGRSPMGSKASEDVGEEKAARKEHYKSGGRLTMAERKALPSKSFALPGKGAGPSGKGPGSYPIPDASHARNALARVSQHGSSEEKARVRARVHAKFPGIGQKEK